MTEGLFQKGRKAPVSKGVARVPVVMQLEALECGAACLCMILAYYNKWIPLEQAREYCGVSRDGSNAKSIVKAAIFYGLDTKAYSLDPDNLRELGFFPCIIHWNFDHFVVLKGFKNNKAYLNDPAKGNYEVSMETFDESFTGICLMFIPSDSFVPSGKPKSMLRFAAKRLKGAGAALLFTMLTGIVSALMGFIQPVFSRVFLDHLLAGKNPDWAVPFLIFLALFSLIQIIMSALTAVYSLRINGQMAAVGNKTYMRKVLRLPMKFFSQRMAGDIQERQSSNASIANSLINTFAPLALNTLMMLFYLFIMLRYSVMLTIVGLVSLSVNAIVAQYISQKRINITRVSMRESARLTAFTVSGIELIETIKASGAENGYFQKWAGYQAGVNAQQVKYLKLDEYLGMIAEFISSLANNTVLFLGVWLTMKGEFTIGMIMAFQGFLYAFMEPAMTLISAGQILQEMRTEMERVDDVMEYPEDNVFNENAAPQTRDHHTRDSLTIAPQTIAPQTIEPQTRYPQTIKKLIGNIEIKNLVFGYSPLGDPVIKNFNLTLSPGKCVAIVGESGSGKSTVSKLISGLYKPWGGELLFDGKAMGEYSKSVFRGSIAVVDQDITLFEDTIANNIRMWDNRIDDTEMVNAARDARIHDDIMKRPDGYEHRFTEGGNDFSGGQRQRIEIARALAQNPSVIIFDEATSLLDARTEYEVIKSIRQRGIVTIIIAHRLSIIRSCDEIIVLQHGEIRDQGTHEELMENSGIYRDLISAE